MTSLQLQLQLLLALSFAPSAAPPPQDAVERLVAAAGKGDVAEVRRLADRERLAGQVGSLGRTALHAAADGGFREVVAVVLDAGAEIDRLTGRGWSALALASERGHVDVVELLLERRANAAPPEASSGSAPLRLAAEAGHLAVTRRLLDAGAPTTSRDPRGWSALHLAAAEGHADVVELLAAHPTAGWLDATDLHGRTALHAAAAAGEVECARLLLDAGAPAEPRDAAGWTPLHLAAACGAPGFDALAALPGVDPEALDPLGRTAVDLARARASGGPSVDLPADVAREGGAPLFALARTMGYPGPVTPPNGLLLAVWEDGVVVAAADPDRAGAALGVARLDGSRLAHLRATVAASGVFDLPPTQRLGMHAPEDRLVWPVGDETARHSYGKTLSFSADSPTENHPGTRALIRARREFHAALDVALPPVSARRDLSGLVDAAGRFRGHDPARPFRSRWLH